MATSIKTLHLSLLWVKTLKRETKSINMKQRDQTQCTALLPHTHTHGLMGKTPNTVVSTYRERERENVSVSYFIHWLMRLWQKKKKGRAMDRWCREDERKNK